MFGPEADSFAEITTTLRRIVMGEGYQRFIPSALSETQPFVDKAGPEILNQMYSFDDRGADKYAWCPK